MSNEMTWGRGGGGTRRFGLNGGYPMGSNEFVVENKAIWLPAASRLGADFNTSRHATYAGICVFSRKKN